MSGPWRKMFRFAVGEAERLGLEMSVNLSSCDGALKGPWEVGDDAPKKLIWTAAERRGPKRVDCQLRRPRETRFWEVALLAARHAPPQEAGMASAVSAGVSEISWSGPWQEVQSRTSTKPTLVEVVRQSQRYRRAGPSLAERGIQLNFSAEQD